MRKFTLSIFNRTNRLRTITFLISSALLITLSLSAGMKNNLLMNMVFVGGIGLLYLSFIHTWRKARSYLFLLVTTSVIFMLLLLFALIVSTTGLDTEMISPSKIQIFTGGLYTILGLSICIPGMIIGLIGSVILGCISNFPVSAS